MTIDPRLYEKYGGRGIDDRAIADAMMGLGRRTGNAPTFMEAVVEGHYRYRLMVAIIALVAVIIAVAGGFGKSGMSRWRGSPPAAKVPSTLPPR